MFENVNYRMLYLMLICKTNDKYYLGKKSTLGMILIVELLLRSILKFKQLNLGSH